MDEQLLALFVSHDFSEPPQFVLCQILFPFPSVQEYLVYIFLEADIEICFKLLFVQELTLFLFISHCKLVPGFAHLLGIHVLFQVWQVHSCLSIEVYLKFYQIFVDAIQHLVVGVRVVEIFGKPLGVEFWDFGVDVVLKAINNAHLFKVALEALYDLFLRF